MSNRSRPDFYSQKAKKEGYMARSVYKLEEIQNKNKLITPGDKVLDVGASPGSWSQYALKLLKGKGQLVGADLKPLGNFKQKNQIHFIQGDVFSDEISGGLAEFAPFDVIISDAAPSTTGNRLVDSRRSYNLVELIINFAHKWLKEDGNFCVKVFTGGDEQELFDLMSTHYEKVKRLKPKAVRNESFETYFIGLGHKAPSQPDL